MFDSFDIEFQKPEYEFLYGTESENRNQGADADRSAEEPSDQAYGSLYDDVDSADGYFRDAFCQTDLEGIAGAGGKTGFDVNILAENIEESPGKIYQYPDYDISCHGRNDIEIIEQVNGFSDDDGIA